MVASLGTVQPGAAQRTCFHRSRSRCSSRIGPPVGASWLSSSSGSLRRRPPPAVPVEPGAQTTRVAAMPSTAEGMAGEDEEILGWNWTGSDAFSHLDDRHDAPPLPLPRLKRSKRVVLVRHGQSTWNARNRIQGSSNFSVLTELGREQAGAAQTLLASWDFECLFVSPLKRAMQTSEVVWGGRRGPHLVLPSLREIDLYTFQGLDKLENRNLYPEQYQNWQNSPANFTIDGHAPVRELWYRASLAWREVLHAKALRTCGLVVAHNAVNQALLCTALGLPPAFFRRFSQSNAAFTVLDFDYPGSSGSSSSTGTADGTAAGTTDGNGGRGEGPPLRGMQPRVRVERMNQFPDRPMSPSKLGRSVPNRLVMICGDVTSQKVQASLSMLASQGVSTPPLIGIGSTAQQVLDVRTAVQAALATPGDGRTVVAVASAAACQQMLGECLGPVEWPAEQAQQGQQARQQDGASVGSLFHMSEGGVTIVNWPQVQREITRGTVLCTNYQLPSKGGSSAG